MKIHIICSRLEADRIVPRLATSLANATHWSIGESPDDNADLNYFFPYLEYPKNGYKKTKTAAWFTHKETTVKAKDKEWIRVAKEVDLRTTSALMYLKDLEKYGTTVLVTTPLDRKKFNYE